MLELYHNDMSTCAQKVRLVLAEKHLEWTSHHMDLRAGDTRTKEYIEKLNPLGVVPTLVDDGTVICESSIINEYLEDAYPEAPLRPTAAKERACMRLWTKQLDDGVHAATATISVGIAFRHQMKSGRSVKDVRDFIDKIPDPARRARMHEIVFEGPASVHFPPAILRFKKLFSDMEASLSRSEWLTGETYSLADIAYVPYLTRVEHLQLMGMLDKHPLTAEWYERTKSRLSYDVALRKWFNPKYLALMKETGEEAWTSVKAIAGY
jgi:glutathione S-transferase